MISVNKSTPFPLTDEQVIKEALKTVTDYARRHPGDTFDIDECIDQTVASVKVIWKKARNYSFYQMLKRVDQDEIVSLLSRIGDDLRARARAKAGECLKKRKILEINMTTAEALIVSELRQCGLKYFFEWQKSQVKVSVKLECGSAITFIIKYKDIRDGKLTGILDKVMAMAELLGGVGVPITVWSSAGSWIPWSE